MLKWRFCLYCSEEQRWMWALLCGQGIQVLSSSVTQSERRNALPQWLEQGLHWWFMQGMYYTTRRNQRIALLLVNIKDDRGSFLITSKKFESAALFLRLGLPSTWSVKELFENALHPRGIWKRWLFVFQFFFFVDEKHFKIRAFRKRWGHDDHSGISLAEFSSDTNPNWPPATVAF